MEALRDEGWETVHVIHDGAHVYRDLDLLERVVVIVTHPEEAVA